MINKQAIILAGGLGTRLRSVVNELPKCMAPVAGRPFLFYVINELRLQGVTDFIFSLGYKHEVIEEYLQSSFSTLRYQVVIENEPLGTGGAIQLACKKASAENVVVTNGDTLFKIDLSALLAFHEQQKADCTLALKPMQDFDRYGVVELDTDQRITAFKEKQFYSSGLINGGTYVLNTKAFLAHAFPEKFSFEKDYLETRKGKLVGLVQDSYFIDIGIPEDYNRAKEELQAPALDLQKIGKDWTLFLDRDGVINVDKEGSYIFNPDQFVFIEGAPGIFKKLTETFGRIVVVTNQRGVGRQLMTETDLAAIHKKMNSAIEGAGGKIDAVYYCTSTQNDDPERKPNPGMAIKAKTDFPAIDFSRSVMIGNNMSDMQFARNAGIYAVFVKTTRPDQELPHPDIDLAFPTLSDFAKAL
jgi:D-glycero-alpha-D-manno-heptose 1-phosphate guanylyltransferase